eukprot:4085965-Pyramimonas_sp.AAC.1
MTRHPAHQDPAGAEFSRAQAIRTTARRLAMEVYSREKISRASRARTPVPRSLVPGQWVFVWRHFSRTSLRGDSLGKRRDGWAGPGVVVLAEGTTIWVAMRTRLWKCSVEQVRLASSDEELGIQIAQSPQWAELLRQAQTRRAAAVDVQREGAPPDEAWDDEGRVDPGMAPQ